MNTVFELIIILWALVHSRFARLPALVAVNIIAFELIQRVIEWKWHITISPGYEIYYFGGAMYFIIMAALFFSVRNKFYAMLGGILSVQAIASGLMLFDDSLYLWHEFINEKMLLLECILVWLSSVRGSNEK